MTKLVLDPMTSGASVAVINENFQKISDELQSKVLYRNNTSGEANSLSTDLDTNGKRVYNLPVPTLPSEAARLQDVQNAVNGANEANLVGFTPAQGLLSTNVQGAIEEVVSRDGDYNVFSHFTAEEIADTLLELPTIDTTAKIQAAIDTASTLKRKVVAHGNFRTSAKIIFKGDADFSGASFKVYGTPPIAIEVSTGNAENPTTILFNSVVWLPKVVINMTKPGLGWGGQGTGVRTVNCYSCKVYLGNIIGFATNFLVTAYGTGNSYNEYYLGHLENGQTNLSLIPGDAPSWVNENNFFGGRFSHYSAEGTNVVGTRHILIPKAAGNVQNNNLFVKPSIEGNTAEYHVEASGAYNTILQGRWEAATPKLLYSSDTTSQATRNIIIGGYNAHNIVYTYTGPGGGNNKTISAGGGFDTISIPFGAQNQSSSSSAISYFYEAGTRPEIASANDWSVFHGATLLQGKRKADLYPRVKLDYQNGRLYFDNGATAAPGAYIANFGANDIALTGCSWKTSTDVAQTLGTTGQRWIGTFSGYLQISTAAVSGAAGTVTIGGTVATTVGAAGGAAALPATPLGYINIFVAGVAAKIPYYTA